MEAAKAWINSGLQDISLPKCDKDGYFVPRQCQPIGGCYCVDRYGNPTTKPSSRKSLVGCRNIIQGTTSAPTTQVQPTKGNNAFNILQIILDKSRFLYNFYEFHEL